MRPEPGSPAEWLQYARSDLAVARQSLGPEVLKETLCFHAQQAAEKAIKAVLVHCGIAFPKLHSIERLVDLLPTDVPRTHDLAAAHELTPFAIVVRYPGGRERITEEQYCEAVRLAEAVVAWAEECVAAGPNQ